MTHQHTDGGPAFPFPDAQGPAPGALTGMSLRDYFAAKALAGICACSDDKVETDTDQVDFIAGRAYAYADAMLRARALQSPAERMREHLDTFGK